MQTTKTTHEKWQEGSLTADEALKEMAGSLSGLEDKLEPLQEMKTVLRGQISEVVEYLGGNVELPGYGKFAIRNATVTKSYDSKALDALVMELVQQGMGDVAQAVANCKKESARTGGLVITKEKEKSARD